MFPLSFTSFSQVLLPCWLPLAGTVVNSLPKRSFEGDSLSMKAADIFRPCDLFFQVKPIPAFASGELVFLFILPFVGFF